MSLPVLHLSGTPYEQGVQQGRALRQLIAHNIDLYFERFKREVGLSREAVLDCAVRYRQAIETQNADFFAGMHGVAEGAGRDLDEIAALNVRYEILYYQNTVILMSDGCTAFAVRPNASANGHLLIGQNWDWIPEVRGAILHTTENDGLETISFTEAGIFGGKIGLNSAGLGLAINGLYTVEDDWTRLTKPFHMRCYEILRQRAFDDALRVVTDTERACSTNYLIAQAPDRVVDLEAAPHKVSMQQAEGGYIVHTNHIVEPYASSIVEPPSESRPFSCHRLDRMSELLRAHTPIDLDDVKAGLSDHDWHPYSICSHEDPEYPPEQQYVTVTSIIMDLHERTMLFSDGNPCVNEYELIGL